MKIEANLSDIQEMEKKIAMLESENNDLKGQIEDIKRNRDAKKIADLGRIVLTDSYEIRNVELGERS